MATGTDTSLESLERAALRLSQLGMSLHEVTEVLPELAKAASAGYGSVDKLASTAPRMMHALGISHHGLAEALGAIVSASSRMPDGEKSLDAIADSLLRVSPLLGRLGWKGQEGLEKYLSYLHQLSTDLGSTEAGGAAMEGMIAMMQSPHTAARFKAAFGKTFDIQGAIAAAAAKGMDPFKAFLEYAECGTEGRASDLHQRRRSGRRCRPCSTAASRWSRRKRGSQRQVRPSSTSGIG